MNKQKYKVYRIEPIEKINQFKINMELPKVIRDTSNWSDLKNKSENFFEDIRNSEFPNMPSRLHSLFVIPYDMDYVLKWADAKYGKEHREYTLLTLELCGELKWFDADLFNDFNSPFPRYSPKEELARHYWRGLDVDYNQIDLVEGLFNGTAVIKRIEPKTHDAII